MAIWPVKGTTKKFQVKVMGIRLEGLPIEGIDGVIAIEIKWEGPPKSGFSSLYRKSQQVRSLFLKEIRVLELGQTIESDGDRDEFDNICRFSMISKDPNLFGPWLVSFQILYGKSESSSSSRAKMQVIGKAGLNLGELASKMEEQIEQKLPVILQMDGVTMEATLRVLVSFIEMRNNSHSRTASQDSLQSVESPSDSASFLRRAKSQGASLSNDKAKKNKTQLLEKEPSSRNSDESNSESEYVVVASSTKSDESNSVTELGQSSLSSEAQLDLVKKGGFWKWKRRKSMKIKAESTHPRVVKKSNHHGSWETREIVSRDGKTKLKSNIFFASYDQRSEKAAGESACAAIVAVIAHWLQLNPYAMPTGHELDNLITEGSSEWRKLCEDESHKEFFPDQHFDLETILRAELRPLDVLPCNSRFGFFHSEKFEHLKDALSFDAIWDEINENVDEYKSSIYIVRWNDHFFILKVEANTNYIVDSLGERLYEGCNQAYILKFDNSTVIYEEEINGEEKVICRGKECCRKYMKRFLAAIPLRELQEEEEKGKTLDVFGLYRRLQIDFHLSNPSSTVSTANTSVSPSPNISPFFLGHHEEYVEV